MGFDQDRTTAGSAPDLAWDEWVALAHALLERALRDAHVRGIFIKGPILTRQGLRRAHQSLDVDVLVDPGRRHVALETLAAHGWSVAVQVTSALTLPLHSVTLRHPRWPLELDVHDRFPGFLADPRTVFEALWQHRSTAVMAGRDVPCLTPVAHSVVAALHWLRDPDLVAHQAELDHLVAALRPRLDIDSGESLAALARETGSASTLAPFLRELGVQVDGPLYDDSLWRIRTASTGLKAVPWLVELRRTPVHMLPGRLAHALVLTEAEIRQAQPEAVPGAWGLFRARLRRIRWGLHDLPKAVRIVWRESRRR